MGCAVGFQSLKLPTTETALASGATHRKLVGKENCLPEYRLRPPGEYESAENMALSHSTALLACPPRSGNGASVNKQKKRRRARQAREIIVSAAWSDYDPRVSSPAYTVRRATLDDLPALRALWSASGVPPETLEKRFTEVQIAQSEDGKISGAIGIKVEGLHGQIHSEAIAQGADPAIYDAFWQRMQIIARNFGLLRLWTDSQGPFWQTLGFAKPDEKALAKLPASFGGKDKLLTLALKEESADGLTVEQQFEIFSKSQRMETERLMQQAQTLKKFVYVILALIVGGLFAAAAIRFFSSPGYKNLKKR